MPVYLDHNALSPMTAVAFEALSQAYKEFGNPSSIHGFGRRARLCLEESRKRILSLLEAEKYNLVVTSGASEANSQLLETFLKRGARIFVSALEHPSLLRSQSPIRIIPVDSRGYVDLDVLETFLKEEPSRETLVSVTWAHNETGIIQPIDKVLSLCRKRGAYVHSDAAQAVGRLPFSLERHPVDYLTITGQKIGGPLGSGALLFHSSLPLEGIVMGGGQERNYRSGTQNTPAFAGFAAALQEAVSSDWGPIETLRDYLEKSLSDFCPMLEIVGKESARLPNTSAFSMPGVTSDIQVMAFDLEGIAVSSGSACSSGKVKISSAFRALGCSEKTTSEMIRVSLGIRTTLAEIDFFIETWKKLYTRTQKLKEKEI